MKDWAYLLGLMWLPVAVKATIVVGPTSDTLGATEKIARMSSPIGETINFAASRLMGPGRCLLEPRLVVMVWWAMYLTLANVVSRDMVESLPVGGSNS